MHSRSVGGQPARAQHRLEQLVERDQRVVVDLDQPRVDAVARGDEAVLVDRLLGRDHPLMREAALELEPRERLDERDEGGGLVDGRLRVHDPHLDRPEAGLRAHVPPEEGRLGDRPAADQQRRLPPTQSR